MKELSERTLPAGEQKRLYSLERQAEDCRVAGRYSDAEDLYSQALLLSTQVFGPDTIETAKVINDLGILYKFMGRFSAASRHYRRALGIIRKIGAAGEPEMSSLYHNLGGLEHARGRRALMIKDKILKSNHPDIAVTLNNLAVLYKSQGTVHRS